ncbi:MAG: glutamate--tRNA ligase [Rickettsiaceae bacterium]|jgi:glutamyl-tRNA synthetase|nr:glutamate--tRNA ligase [Rickettsiaceae bacterium]
MNVVTRFAPSPTGFLHIGGARTALFNYLFSKNNNGKFLLRIEDTDQKRSTDEAKQAIIDGLSWLGLKHDGEIVLQSKNLERHKQVAMELLERGQAYYCYTSAEELEEMRSKAEKNGQVFCFKSEWRDKKLSQASSVKPVIRIKAPTDGQTIIKDLVQGEIKVANSELDDLVMLRGDGTPTYMLAVVVDDHDMEISHVIRGDDHLTNAFRQKIIYQAMGWKVPEFAHIPLIHGSDGAKMSKRHGATSVIDYQKMGYLPEAVCNYLLRLGWSHGNDEIISGENAIKWFNLENVGKSPARFDFAKLDNLNKHYIKEKSEEELFDLVTSSQPNSEITKQLQENKTKILRSLKFIKERAIKIFDLLEPIQVYVDGFRKDLDQKDLEILKQNPEIIFELAEAISKIENWNHDEIKNAINNFATSKNLKIKDFGPALRIALTFSSASAGGLFDVIEILGKNEIERRIKQIKI